MWWLTPIMTRTGSGSNTHRPARCVPRDSHERFHSCARRVPARNDRYRCRSVAPNRCRIACWIGVATGHGWSYASANPAHGRRRGRITMTEPAGGTPNPPPTPPEPAAAPPAAAPAPPPAAAAPPVAAAPPPAAGQPAGRLPDVAVPASRGRGRTRSGDPVRRPRDQDHRVHHRRHPRGHRRVVRDHRARGDLPEQPPERRHLHRPGDRRHPRHREHGDQRGLLHLLLDARGHAGIAGPEGARHPDRERRRRRHA